MKSVLTLAVLVATTLPATVLPAFGQASGGDPAAVAITGEDPALIQRLMQDLGYRADLATDEGGDPLIRSAAGGVNFEVYYYDCEGGKTCNAIQFVAGFDMANGTTLEVLNDWNRANRYGRAYLDDESDPYLEMDMNLWGGGISPATFKDNLEIWESLLGDFQQHIDW